MLFLTTDDDVADTIRPRLEAHGANVDRVFFVPSLADLRHDFAKLEATLDRIPDCRLIVVDPVNAYVGPSDSHFHTIVRKVLSPLAKLAARRADRDPRRDASPQARRLGDPRRDRLDGLRRRRAARVDRLPR